jgi:hypothetical protein
VQLWWEERSKYVVSSTLEREKRVAECWAKWEMVAAGIRLRAKTSCSQAMLGSLMLIFLCTSSTSTPSAAPAALRFCYESPRKIRHDTTRPATRTSRDETYAVKLTDDGVLSGTGNVEMELVASGQGVEADGELDRSQKARVGLIGPDARAGEVKATTAGEHQQQIVLALIGVYRARRQ